MSDLDLSVFHCTAGLRHRMQDCIYFLTSNDVNLPIERCRRVVSSRPKHGCHGNPPPLPCDVLPGLCGRPGVGIRASRAPCQTENSALSKKSDNIFHSSQESYAQNHLIASICSWSVCVLKTCTHLAHLWHTHHCSGRPWRNPTC